MIKFKFRTFMQLFSKTKIRKLLVATHIKCISKGQMNLLEETIYKMDLSNIGSFRSYNAQVLLVCKS